MKQANIKIEKAKKIKGFLRKEKKTETSGHCKNRG